MVRPLSLARHFQSSARRHPERVALIWSGGEVTYSQMQEMVDGLRDALPAAARIGILADRTPFAFAAIQAILSRGASYVPLRPSTPARHNAMIRNLSGFSVVVVDETGAEALDALMAESAHPLVVVAPENAPTVHRMVAGRQHASLLVARRCASRDDASPVPEPASGEAVLLFTSGSTGTPKGVVCLHSAVESYIASFLDSFPIFPDDRLAQNSDLTFDASIHDMFLAWSSGAALVVFPDDSRLRPLEFASRTGVTIWFSISSLPSLLEAFGSARDAALPRVRLSVFGGEKLMWSSLRIWRRIAPHSRNVNLYGLTETTVATHSFEIPPDFPENGCHLGVIPIGGPFPSVSAEIRRPDGTPCGPGEPGILWIGGPQLCGGYLEASATSERFVERGGMVWFRTGDVVFAEASGTTHFIGREDFQLKVMGYRIESGEIEAALLRESGAPFAVVDVARIRGDQDELVCVLPTSCIPRKRSIREALRRELESHMLPRIWLFRDDLPLNSNGKIDRAALREEWRSLDLER